MNRKELSARAADLLRENDVRKPVKIKKHVFIVTDEDGNSANFNVKRADKKVLYSVDDVQNILDACVETMRSALQNGETIVIKDFGTISLHLRAARKAKRPDNGEWCDIPAHYIPKMSFAKPYRMAAKIFELNANEEDAIKKLHELAAEDSEMIDEIAEDDDLIDYPDLDW